MTSTLPQIETQTLAALLTATAFAPINDLGWIRVTGSDRVRWLNGMVTNSIAALKPGEGCYNFFLNNQGRIQGDATAWMQEDAILLETALDRVPALIALLDRFIIMDEVELTDISSRRRGILVAGPDAAALLPHTPPREPMTSIRESELGRELTILHAHSPLVPRFELWSDAVVLDNFVPPIPKAMASDLYALRLLEGTPLYGTDIRNTDTAKDLPQETGQSRALHFSKGCYLGQEIVERIRSRGNVHRNFSGFLLTGDLPPAGTPLTAEDTPGKPVGELTSVASIPLPSGPIQVGLGYIRREALDRNATLIYPGGHAAPASLPFAAGRARVNESASEQTYRSQESS